MCFNQIRIKILEAQIKSVTKDIDFETQQSTLVGDSGKIESLMKKRNRLEKTLVDLQAVTYIPSDQS